ncbi:MAG: RelA/SpoT domain-containing protein [Acidimicrobiales bacterium]
MPPSKTSVDKAGALLRDWWGDQEEVLNDAEVAAADTVWDYRKQFQYPLTKTNANLRYYVKKAGHDVFIAQRLKRLPRIVEKLHRHPRMRLSQMQDVGGCRAILRDEVAIREVLAGVLRNWDVITVDDYIQSPKPDGYRAVHVIVRNSGVPIEVQLRTPGQQDWADEVERLDGLLPSAVKDGEGSPEVVWYLQVLAEIIRTVEAGEVVDNAVIQDFIKLRGLMP